MPSSACKRAQRWLESVVSTVYAQAYQMNAGRVDIDLDQCDNQIEELAGWDFIVKILLKIQP